MQRETKQSISVLALLFAIFVFAGYGYAATANYTNISNIYNYSVFNNSGITYNGTNLYNYYNNDTFQSIGYDILANILYFEYHNVSFSSTGFEHNNSTIYNNYNNSIIDNINQLNSTITNYYNYTNYDHASLQNLSYSVSGHTGFESSSHASTTYETISNVVALGTAYRVHEHQSPFGGALGNGGQVSYTDLKNKPNLSEKLNKSGDNMTSGLYIFVNNTNESRYSDVSGLTNVNNGVIMLNENSWQTFSMFSYANQALGGTFGGHMARWNQSNSSKSALLSGDAPFYFFSKGWDGSTWGVSAGRIYMETTANWNTTSHPIQIRFMTKGKNDVANTIILTDDGSIQINNLAGSGNASACLDSNGKLYRGSPTC